MLALIDATMSDLREVDNDAHTVFAGWTNDEGTEVNLDLSGALESALEQETRVRPTSVPGAIPLDFATMNGPSTVNQRSPLAPGLADDLLVEEEFSISDSTEEDDLPMLDSREFVAAPPVDDLMLPRRGRSVRARPVSLVAPEPPPLVYPLAKVPLAAIGANKPVRVVVGTPIIAMHQDKPLSLLNGGLLWVSAIAFWAATMLGAWALRMELFELIGL